MATVTWKSASTGNWNTPGAWSTGVIPGSGDTAEFNVTGASYTVTLPARTLNTFALDINSANASVLFASGTTTYALTGGVSIEAGTLILGFSGNILNIGTGLTVSGGLFSETAGKTTAGSVTLSGGTTQISGGTFTDSGAFAISTGTFTVSGTGLATLATGIATGSSGTLTVSGGGDLVFASNSLAASATVTFSGASDGVFFDTASGAAFSTAFTSFGKTDVLGFLGTISGESYTGSTLTVTTTGGMYTFNNFGFGAPDRTFVTGTKTVGGVAYNTIELVCFVTGTRILTERGEIAVEDIAAGDRVVTLEDGAEVLRSVTWVGNRRLDIGAHARPELAAPVRIRAGAFGEALPQRDLLLSPDHCLFVDGKLVPAKLLVNDMTIVNERAISTVTYYHVELERHAVLLAEGLPAESYLDTGNRAFFPDSGLATVLHPEFHVNAGHRAWDNACAPLASDPAEVESLWHRLAARAEALGHVRPTIQTTTDADLHVMADGKAVRPVAVSAGRHVFVLPAGATSIRLESRYAIPADLVPYSDDRRRLGVAIGRITVRSDAGQVEIPADHPILSRGWHTPERAGAKVWRWTDGDADLPLAPTAGAVMVEVQVQSTATYPLREAQPRRLAA